MPKSTPKSQGTSNYNNRSNQMNPNNSAYFRSHGWGTTQPAQSSAVKPSNYQSHVPLSGNNTANQSNPNFRTNTTDTK